MVDENQTSKSSTPSEEHPAQDTHPSLLDLAVSGSVGPFSEQILPHLDFNDVVRLSRVSKGFQELLVKKVNKQAQMNEVIRRIVCGDSSGLQKLFENNPSLLLDRSGVATDFSGREFKGLTPFEAALKVGDVDMCQMMIPYFHRLRDGDVELKKQCHKIFPRSVKDFYQNLKRDAFDFDSIISDFRKFRGVFNQPLSNFREAYAKYALHQTIFNPYDLIKVLRLIMEEFSNDKFGLTYALKFIYGFVQRFATANIAKTIVNKMFVQNSLCYILQSRKSWHYFPLEEGVGLGFDFYLAESIKGDDPFLYEHATDLKVWIDSFEQYIEGSIDQLSNIVDSILNTPQEENVTFLNKIGKQGSLSLTDETEENLTYLKLAKFYREHYDTKTQILKKTPRFIVVMQRVYDSFKNKQHIENTDLAVEHISKLLNARGFRKNSTSRRLFNMFFFGEKSNLNAENNKLIRQLNRAIQIVKYFKKDQQINYINLKKIIDKFGDRLKTNKFKQLKHDSHCREFINQLLVPPKNEDIDKKVNNDLQMQDVQAEEEDLFLKALKSYTDYLFKHHKPINPFNTSEFVRFYFKLYSIDIHENVKKIYTARCIVDFSLMARCFGGLDENFESMALRYSDLISKLNVVFDLSPVSDKIISLRKFLSVCDSMESVAFIIDNTFDFFNSSNDCFKNNHYFKNKKSIFSNLESIFKMCFDEIDNFSISKLSAGFYKNFLGRLLHTPDYIYSYDDRGILNKFKKEIIDFWSKNNLQSGEPDRSSSPGLKT